MNEKQIKRHFEDNGLKIADVAREMQKSFTSISFDSAETMLRQLIKGDRWYPVYSQWLFDTYGITVDRPAYLPPVRERMMRLAA